MDVVLAEILGFIEVLETLVPVDGGVHSMSGSGKIQSQVNFLGNGGKETTFPAQPRFPCSSRIGEFLDPEACGDL